MRPGSVFISNRKLLILCVSIQSWKERTRAYGMLASL
jgi:hypothetical protein